MRLPSLSIAIACYYDEGTIARVIEESAEAASKAAERFKVLAVDDGSQDGSPAILRALAAKHDWLECRYHEKNQGFGGTFGELYTYAACDFNAILPGDGQIAAAQVTRMAEAMGASDVVLGVRATRMDSFRRRMNSAAYNLVVSCVAGRPVHDVNSISLARTALVRNARLSAKSAFIHAEFLLECYRLGARVSYLEIEHLPRTHGSGAGGKISVISSTVGELASYVGRRGLAWKRPRAPAPAPRES